MIAARETLAAAREAENRLRQPLNEAERKAQRLETEARTLAKLVTSATGDLWPPALDQITVQKGYETALGAALGRRSRSLDQPFGARPLGRNRRRRRAIRPCRTASGRSPTVAQAPAALCSAACSQIGVVEQGRRPAPARRC